MSLTRLRRSGAAVLLATALAACGGDDPEPAAAPAPTATASPATSTPASAAPTGRPDPAAAEVLFTGLQAPWGIGFLPDGDALVTERDTARVLRLPAGGGEPVVVTTVAQARPSGEGGLLGLAVSPRFAEDRLVYLYLTAEDDNRVVSFPLDDPARVETVVSGIPKAGVHNGGRLAFGPDGALYIGTGDAGRTELAQDDESLGGKVLRLGPGGELTTYSKGHRNVQGLAFDDAGRLLSVEFGQDRFDEVNVLTGGTNGGWPEVEGAGDGGGRYLAPLVTWTTDEASPSGAAVAGGSLWVAALRGERLWEVPLAGGQPRPWLQGEYGRLRAAVTAPDGSLWVLTSNRDGRGDPADADDRVLRLPAR